VSHFLRVDLMSIRNIFETGLKGKTILDFHSTVLTRKCHPMMHACIHALLSYYCQSFVLYCIVLYCIVVLDKDALIDWSRLFFQKAGEKYPDVIADKVVMSFACGRSVPDSLVDDKYRNPHGQLLAPCLTSYHNIVLKLILFLCTEAHSIRTDDWERMPSIP